MMKYLGKFELDQVDLWDDGEECSAWVNIEDEEDVISNEFMVIKNSPFDAVMGESNTSGLGIKLSPCGEIGKIWRVW